MNTLPVVFGHVHLYETVDMKMLQINYKLATVTKLFLKLKIT